MALSVGHEGNQVIVSTFLTAEQPVGSRDQDLDDVNVLPLVEPSYIIGIGDLSLVEDKVNGPRVVFHIQPVTHILSCAIDRERLAVAYIVDEQRNKLLRELVRTIVVRAVRNNRRHTVGVVERPHEMV